MATVRIQKLRPPKTADSVNTSQVFRDAAGGIRTIGNAATTTNIQGGRAGTTATVQDLLAGGFRFLDPEAQAAIDAYTRTNRVTPEMLAEQRTLTDRIETLQGRLDSGKNAAGKPLTRKQKISLTNRIKKANNKLSGLTTQIDTRTQRVADFTAEQTAGAPLATDVLRQADPEFYRNLDRAQGIANTIGEVTPEGQRFLDAAGRGYQAGEITSRDVERGALGESLYSRASQMAQSDGRLSPEANRDAVQAARQAFAARGLGTSSGSAAAELLNRDQYSRQRMFQDLAFAGGVQESEMARQQNNANRALQAMGMNEDARRMGTVTNNEMLYNAAGYRDALKGQGLGASLQMAGIQQAANPLFRLMGMNNYAGGAGSEALGAATNLAGNVANTNANVGMFNAEQANQFALANWNAQNWANAQNAFRPSFNSGMGSALGGIGGSVLGAGAGALIAGLMPGGMGATTGALLGAGLGGGLGSGFGGLFGR